MFSLPGNPEAAHHGRETFAADSHQIRGPQDILIGFKEHFLDDNGKHLVFDFLDLVSVDYDERGVFVRFENVSYGIDKDIDRSRLPKHKVRTLAQQDRGRDVVKICGIYNHRDFPAALDFMEHFKAIFSGHHEVQDHEIEFVMLELFDCILRSGGRENLVSEIAFSQDCGLGIDQINVVINEQYFCHGVGYLFKESHINGGFSRRYEMLKKCGCYSPQERKS